MGQNISKCWGVISVTYSSDGIELPLKVKLRVQYQGSNYGTQFKFQLKNSFYFPSFQHVVTPRNGEPTTLKLRMERNPNASFANFSPIFQLFINGDYYEHNLTEIRMGLINYSKFYKEFQLIQNIQIHSATTLIFQL